MCRETKGRSARDGLGCGQQREAGFHDLDPDAVAGQHGDLERATRLGLSHAGLA
jgi:hypothetical protein